MPPSLRDLIDDDIVNSVTKEYEDTSTWLPYSALEIKEVFDTDQLKELDVFIADMKNATDENARKAKLINNVSKYAGTVVKLLKIAKVAI
jgi:hypothetical protein